MHMRGGKSDISGLPTAMFLGPNKTYVLRSSKATVVFMQI